jgi:predicted DNA-binding transcriptional regulator AlpA
VLSDLDGLAQELRLQLVAFAISHAASWQGNQLKMASHSSFTGGPTVPKAPASTMDLLTPREVAARLKVSLSWLAKARMRGDGPPYIPVGRSIRYAETSLIQWMRSQHRTSTSE